MHVDRGWLEEGITLGQSAVSDESSVRSQSDGPMHQGDKVHKTVRRLFFVIRATRAARDEQLREHKTFLKASRWVHSRAATGRGAGCARCPLTTRPQQPGRSGDSCGNECRTHSRELRRLSLTFGGSAPRRPKRTQPDQGKTQREQLRDDRIRTQIDHLTRMTTETRRSRADECTIAGSRAEQSLTKCAERRLRTDFEAQTPTTKQFQRRAKVDHAWHGGIHDMPTTRWPT